MTVVRVAVVVFGLLLLGSGLAVVRGRRRRAASALGTREEALRAARVATRQISRQSRRNRRGTIRGQGAGGNDTLSHDAAYGSDGGTPSGT